MLLRPVPPVHQPPDPLIIINHQLRTQPPPTVHPTPTVINQRRRPPILTTQSAQSRTQPPINLQPPSPINRADCLLLLSPTPTAPSRRHSSINHLAPPRRILAAPTTVCQPPIHRSTVHRRPLNPCRRVATCSTTQPPAQRPPHPTTQPPNHPPTTQPPRLLHQAHPPITDDVTDQSTTVRQPPTATADPPNHQSADRLSNHQSTAPPTSTTQPPIHRSTNHSTTNHCCQLLTQSTTVVNSTSPTAPVNRSITQRTHASVAPIMIYQWPNHQPPIH